VRDGREDEATGAHGSCLVSSLHGSTVVADWWQGRLCAAWLRPGQVVSTYTYALEELYSDQDYDWVVDTIPAVLAWVPGKSQRKNTQPFRFPLRHLVRNQTVSHELDLSWSTEKLLARDAEVLRRADRLRTGKTVHREHMTEVAAYGLTLVAISVLMPGRRVTGMNLGVAPDFLFDATPGRITGVETAGRSTGGWGALGRLADGTRTEPGKRAQLLARNDIAEVHLSLWCGSARSMLMEQVRP